MKEFKEKVRRLVSNTKVEQALNELLIWGEKHQDADLIRAADLLKGKYKDVKRKELMGMMNYTDTLQHQMMISNSILELLDGLELKKAEEEKQGENAKEPQSTTASRQTILFLASSPENIAKLQLEKEFLQISSKLQIVERYKLIVENVVTPDALHEAILLHRPNIVHFSGHGNSADDKRGGGLFLQNRFGQAKLVKEKALANLFRIAAKKFKIDMVVLNACYSKPQAESMAEYVPYVIGTEDQVNDDAAIIFSAGFYRGLVSEDNIDDAFELAINLVEMEGFELDHQPILHKKEEE